MKIKELLNSGKVTISCEIFPPKVDADFEKVEHAAKEIAALSPAYMSVTYGASGGTSSHTVEIASKMCIRDRIGSPRTMDTLVECMGKSLITVTTQVVDPLIHL